MENNREFFEVCFGADRAGLYYLHEHPTHFGQIAYITLTARKGFITSAAMSEIFSVVEAASGMGTDGCFEPN